MSGINTKIKVSIYLGNDETKLLSSKFLKDCNGISTYLSNDIYNETYKTIYENTFQLVKEFKNEINKASNLPDNYTIQVAVTDDSGYPILDKFILHFKYLKFSIIPDPSINLNELISPSLLNFTAKLSDNTVMQSDQLIWTVEPSGGGVIVNNGNVDISNMASGKYVIKAVVKDTVAIHGGKEAIYEINVASSTGLLQINPSKFKIGIFEDTAIEARVDGAAVSAQWAIVDGSGNVIDDSVNKTSGTISAGSVVASPAKSNSPGISASRCIYRAPEQPGDYIILATYGDKTATVKITVMPLTMVITMPPYMAANAVQSFSVNIKGITEPKTIEAKPDGGTVANVSEEYKPGASPEENLMIFTKNFSLGASDVNDKYTITAKLLNIPIDKSVQRSINIVRGITATPKGASIAPGGQLQLEAAINGGGGMVATVWTLEGVGSGNIISDVEGTTIYVAPATPGTYKITAKYLDYTDETYVTVTPASSALVITFSPLDPVIYPAEVIKIKAIVNSPKLYEGFNITNDGGEMIGPLSHGVTADAKSYFFEYSFSVPAGDNKETVNIEAKIMESGEVIAKATNTIKVVRGIFVTPKSPTIATAG